MLLVNAFYVTYGSQTIIFAIFVSMNPPTLPLCGALLVSCPGAWVLLVSSNKTNLSKKKKRMLQNRLFLRCLACLALFGAVRTIHAEVVEGEGDAQSWRLRVFR